MSEPFETPRSAAPQGERMTPFHCPYCGDQDLHPHGPERGSWECRSCLRAFTLAFTGHLSRSGGAR